MFIERHMSSVLSRMKEFFPVVLVTGARQVGKTTMLKNDLTGIRYFTLDDPMTLDLMRTDPTGFITNNRPPIILDEIQYSPGIMRNIKMIVDERKTGGEYFLAGSQQFRLMKDVSESLAGRMGILSLSGLSTREMNKEPFREPFLPTDEYYQKREGTVTASDVQTMWKRIHLGSMPRLFIDGRNRSEFYSTYVNTYIERDVRALTQVGDESSFFKFLTVCAARTGELLNLTRLANDIGISEKTAKRWLSILVTSDIVYLLQPFSMNMTGRVVKTPKLYFMDTGLASYLCKWLTPETLESGAMAGQMFETYVVTEIIKSYRNAGRDPPIYFYRDADKREIDLLIHQDGTLYPVEIKASSSPYMYDLKHFETLKRFTSLKVAPGALICTYDKLRDMAGGNTAVPVSYV